MTKTDVASVGCAFMDAELTSQPDVWARAIEQARWGRRPTASAWPCDRLRHVLVYGPVLRRGP